MISGDQLVILPGEAPGDRYLSMAEIAQYLGVKEDTVYRWITANRLPAHKVGRLWKSQKAEVDEFIRKGKI